jgi:hypothetical protein
MPRVMNSYTHPALRERIKRRIMRGSKGGGAGQWSARKAQLLAAEYKRAGGGYLSGKASVGAKSLNKWTREKWRTADGMRARRSAATDRYLPDKAWSKLSPAEKQATRRKKLQGSRRGKQYVPNTDKARRAR